MRAIHLVIHTAQVLPGVDETWLRHGEKNVRGAARVHGEHKFETLADFKGKSLIILRPTLSLFIKVSSARQAVS